MRIRWSSGTFFRAGETDGRHEPASDVAGYEFRELDGHSFASDQIFRAAGRRDRFRKRHGGIHRCFGYTEGRGAVASYLWLTTAMDGGATVPWEKLELELPPGTGYIWDCRTHEDHRGKGLYRSGLRNCIEIALSQGSREVYIYVSHDNIPSRRGVRSAGFRSLFDVRTVALSRWCIVRKEGGFPVILQRGEPVDLLSGRRSEVRS